MAYYNPIKLGSIILYICIYIYTANNQGFSHCSFETTTLLFYVSNNHPKVGRLPIKTILQVEHALLSLRSFGCASKILCLIF